MIEATSASRFLFLYTELAPYFLACVDRLVRDHGAEVRIVHWPVNAEAPFLLDADPRISRVPRRERTDEQLLKECLDWAPHAVFASGWVDRGYLRVCRALRQRGVPTVMCSDTAWRGDARQWAAVVVARTWLPRTFSHAWVTGAAQSAYARRLGFPKDRIRTGFYAADVDRFTPLGAAREGSAAPVPHRLLCVARYIPTKGHQVLCDAFAGLCEGGHAADWELWLVGTGELHQQVMASASGRHPRIHHKGFVQAADLPALMAHCGAFVLPSTYEPWGVVVQEQACAGMPLLLSDAVGAAERFLEDGRNGFRFPAGDGHGLARTLERLFSLPDADLRVMGRHSMRLGAAWGPRDWAATANAFTLPGT